MVKRKIFLLTLIMLMIGVKTVSANVPQVTNLVSVDESDGRSLTITVNHLNPSSTHYVNQLEVSVGGNVQTVDLDPESSINFNETVKIAATGDVKVRAHCTVHGWGSWATLQTAQTTPSSGIPGFPVLGLFIGVVLFIALYYQKITYISK